MSQDWANFFSVLAQVAVTAFSVMFLSMQVRSREWRQNRLRSVAAVAALVELFVPLLAGMVTTMGAHPWRVAAALAAAVGLGMVAIHVAIYFADRGGHTPPFDRKQALGAWLSFVIYGLALTAAFLPDTEGMYLLAGVCVWLLLSGSFEAWWLLEPTGLEKPSPAAPASEDAAARPGSPGA